MENERQSYLTNIDRTSSFLNIFQQSHIGGKAGGGGKVLHNRYDSKSVDISVDETCYRQGMA